MKKSAWMVFSSVVLVGAILWAVVWRRPRPHVTHLSNDSLKQELKTAKYEIDRGLFEYLFNFGSDLGLALRRANSATHVVDFGAGGGQFAFQLAGLEPMTVRSGKVPYGSRFFGITRWFSSRPDGLIPRVTAITYETNIMGRLNGLKATSGRSADFIDQHIEVFQGRLLREIPSAELTRRFGPVDIGVDLWGVMAYTHTPSEDLAKIYQIMRVGARYFMRADIGKQGHPLSFVQTANGKVGFDKYLTRHLKGFRIQKITGSSRHRKKRERHVLILTKNDEAFSFPKLKFLGLKPGSEAQPVRRTFSEMTSSQGETVY